MEMRVLEFLHDLFIREEYPVDDYEGGNYLTLGLGLAGFMRTVRIDFKGGQRIHLLIYLQTLDSIGKRELRRLRLALDSTALDEGFAGDLYTKDGALWWKLETCLSTDAESAEEVITLLIQDTQEDFFRLDVIRGLSSMGKSPRTIRKAVAVLGMVEGFA